MVASMRKLITFVVLITLYQSVFAEGEGDFVIAGSSCKMLVSYNVISEESIKVIDSDTPTLFCTRNSKKVSCDITHSEGSEEKVIREYSIELDSPPFMLMETENGSDAIFINTRDNSASFSSRVLNEKMMVLKLCSGLFLPLDQYIPKNKDS